MESNLEDSLNVKVEGIESELKDVRKVLHAVAENMRVPVDGEHGETPMKRMELAPRSSSKALLA